MRSAGGATSTEPSAAPSNSPRVDETPMYCSPSHYGELGAGLPRIVAAETPDVTLQITAGIASAAIVLILDIPQHRGASGLGPRVMRVAIGDDDVGALRLGAADFVRMLHQAAE